MLVGHVLQDPCGLLLKVPAGQGLQTAAPTSEWYPCGQEVQLVAAIPSVKVLAGQSSQEPPCSPLNVPAGQGVHSEAPTDEKCPKGQEVQLVALWLLKVLAGQTSQES